MRFAAVVPAAPALLSELTGGPVAELEPVRRATAAALRRVATVFEDGARPLVVLAPGNATRRLRAVAVTGLDGFGVALPPAPINARRPPVPDDQGVRTTPASTRPPIGAALGLRLLAEAGVDVRDSPRLVVQEVDQRELSSVCGALGRALVAEVGADAVWLVLGDGSARRTPKAPGAFDPDAQPFDEAAAKALDTADPAALAALDSGRATRLMAAGRAPWQVLAGAAGSAPVAPAGPCLTCHEAPLGVGYLVATWDFTGSGAMPAGPPRHD